MSLHDLHVVCNAHCACINGVAQHREVEHGVRRSGMSMTGPCNGAQTTCARGGVEEMATQTRIQASEKMLHPARKDLVPQGAASEGIRTMVPDCQVLNRNMARTPNPIIVSICLSG